MHVEVSFMSGLMLMFVLGLRHGLDPDHIACIDGLTWRAIGDGHSHVKWIGTLFALGHGLLVTLIAVVVSELALHFSMPGWASMIFEWIPTALLFIVGLLNLRLLLTRVERYVPVGKMHFIPAALRRRSSTWSVVVIGVLFATVFDTATQAAAWGYVAANKDGGVWLALFAGLAFTAGMMVTDTLDGRLICRISHGLNASGRETGFRRAFGWLIVAISFAVAVYNIFKAIAPQLELDDLAFSLTGAGLVLSMGLILGWTNRKILLQKMKGLRSKRALVLFD